MRSVRLDNTARLCAASSLLLLIVAQQKLCPWLRTVPESPASAAGHEGQRERKRAVLPYVVPDVSAPRWSGAAQSASVRHSIGSHDGVPRWGAQRPLQPATDDVFADAPHWPVLDLIGVSDGECVVAAQEPIRLHPALRSTIRPTGPPC